MIGKERSCRTIELSGTQGLTFSPDGQHLAVATKDGIQIIDPNNGHTSQTIPVYGENNEVLDAAYSPDGKHLACLVASRQNSTSQADTFCWVLGLESREKRSFRLPTRETPREIIASPGGQRLIARPKASHEKLLVWSWDDSRTEDVRCIGPTGPRSVSCLPDGQRIVVSAPTREARSLWKRRSTATVWNLQSGRREGIVFSSDSDTPIRSVVAPDGQHLAISDQDHQTIRVIVMDQAREIALDFQKPELKIDLSAATGRASDKGRTKTITCTPGLRIDFSADRQTVASDLVQASAIALWNTLTGRTETIAHGEQGRRIIFSPDGQQLVLAADNCLLIWTQR